MRQDSSFKVDFVYLQYILYFFLSEVASSDPSAFI